MAKEMHDGGSIGDVVQSIVFTKEVYKMLGLQEGKIGWFIKMKINDDATWERVKSGELKAFSVGGYANRVPVSE
jgi:hypothetical protein